MSCSSVDMFLPPINTLLLIIVSRLLPALAQQRRSIEVGILYPEGSPNEFTYTRAMNDFVVKRSGFKDYEHAQSFDITYKKMSMVANPNFQSVCKFALESFHTAIYFPEGNQELQKQWNPIIDRLAGPNLKLIAHSNAREYASSPVISQALQLSPSFEQQCEALLSIVVLNKWKRFIFVTSSSTKQSFVTACINDVYRSKFIKSLVLEVGFSVDEMGISEIENVFRAIHKKPHPAVILLLLPWEETGAVIDAAQRVGLDDDRTEGVVWIAAPQAVTDRAGRLARATTFPQGTIALHYAGDSRAIFERTKLASSLWLDGLLGSRSPPPVPKYSPAEIGDICRRLGGGNRRLRRHRRKFRHRVSRSASSASYTVKNVDRISKVTFDENYQWTHPTLDILNNGASASKWDQVGNWSTSKGAHLEFNSIVWPGRRLQPPPWTVSSSTQTLANSITIILSICAVHFVFVIDF